MRAGFETTVKAVRTDVAKWQRGQTLAPIAVAVSIIARRTMAPTLLLAAGGLLATAGVLFIQARRSLGRCELHALGDRVRLNHRDAAAEITRGDVRAWTFQGGTARLYTADAGWRLAVLEGEAQDLRQILAPIFGAPLLLQRRGSVRARQVAGGVALTGAVLVAVAIAFHFGPLVVAGVLIVLFGLGALGALSQRVAKGRTSAG
jgi:hypothetical protein